jgi:hypothetical protein
MMILVVQVLFILAGVAIKLLGSDDEVAKVMSVAFVLCGCLPWIKLLADRWLPKEVAEGSAEKEK